MIKKFRLLLNINKLMMANKCVYILWFVSKKLTQPLLHLLTVLSL